MEDCGVILKNRNPTKYVIDHFIVFSVFLQVESTSENDIFNINEKKHEGNQVDDDNGARQSIEHVDKLSSKYFV